NTVTTPEPPAPRDERIEELKQWVNQARTLTDAWRSTGLATPLPRGGDPAKRAELLMTALDFLGFGWAARDGAEYAGKQFEATLRDTAHLRTSWIERMAAQIEQDLIDAALHNPSARPTSMMFPKLLPKEAVAILGSNPWVGGALTVVDV